MSLDVRLSRRAAFTLITLAGAAWPGRGHEILVSHEVPLLAFCSLLDGRRHDDGDQPAVRIYDYRRGALVQEIHYWHGQMCAGPRGRPFRHAVAAGRCVVARPSPRSRRPWLGQQ